MGVGGLQFLGGGGGICFLFIFSKQKHAMHRSREGWQGSRSLLENHEAIGFLSKTCHRVEGGQGSAHLLENQEAIGFHSKTGPNHLENHKATKPAFNFIGPSSAHQ